jgi:hypothetical protein
MRCMPRTNNSPRQRIAANNTTKRCWRLLKLDRHAREAEVTVLLSRSNANEKRLRRFSRTAGGSALQSRNNGRLNARLIDLI